MKKNQSKYFYTATLMNEALLSLLEKKPFDFITVTDITKKAGVNRSTFYLHYDNVYELLEETIENLNKKFFEPFDNNLPVNIESKADAFLITTKYLTPYLHFVKENKNAIKVAHKHPKLFNNDKVYKSLYEKIFMPAISQFINDEKDKIYQLEFFTQGVVGIINKWLDLNCVDEIDNVIKIIKKCIPYNEN